MGHILIPAGLYLIASQEAIPDLPDEDYAMQMWFYGKVTLAGELFLTFLVEKRLSSFLFPHS